MESVKHKLRSTKPLNLSDLLRDSKENPVAGLLLMVSWPFLLLRQDMEVK